MILISTHLMLKKFMENLCHHVSITLGHCLCNGQNYDIVCPNLTYRYLWRCYCDRSCDYRSHTD